MLDGDTWNGEKLNRLETREVCWQWGGWPLAIQVTSLDLSEKATLRLLEKTRNRWESISHGGLWWVGAPFQAEGKANAKSWGGTQRQCTWIKINQEQSANDLIREVMGPRPWRASQAKMSVSLKPLEDFQHGAGIVWPPFQQCHFGCCTEIGLKGNRVEVRKAIRKLLQ